MIKYSENALALIVLDSVLGFEYKHKIKLLSLVKEVEELFDCPKVVKDYLFECVGESKARTIIGALTENGYHDFVLNGLDKTGTVTLGKPEVTDIISANDNNELLTLAASLEVTFF